ncbi:phage holin family protein [Piscinibacter gummiphilus]|uniref:Phage holin family protein n=1 Tax=Piscinibacter gummiphilus TaxID=946333 RepID=A0ABZ0CNM6_9BURK|nr:phage holin family protein [Piscinibacter gummiphilus]WOB06489.1 phage holin family protein [Piscinibacter gummiphilus]
MSLLIQVVLCIYLLMPQVAMAADAVKDPLAIPLRQYGLMLGLAIFGGIVSWYSKVRKGELHIANLSSLVGEMATSAFSGLLAFYLCEYLGLVPVLTAAVVGVAGHMGTRAITAIEKLLQKRFPEVAVKDPSQPS